MSHFKGTDIYFIKELIYSKGGYPPLQILLALQEYRY